MKKIFLLSGLLIAGLTFTSCSDDDSNGNNNNNNDSEIAGTYNLAEVNTAQDTDFNQDGTFSENQMDESDCYDDTAITFNADNTGVYQQNSILVNQAQGTSACSDNTYNGTWEIFASGGTTIVIDFTYEDNNGTERTMQFIKQGARLVHTNVFGSYPNRNNNGGATNTTGTVEYVFNKQ